MVQRVPLSLPRIFPATSLRPALLSDPPTSAFGRWGSKAPSLSVGLFTMPQIHHGGAIEAHRLHPLTLSVEEPHKGSLVRGPSAVVNLTQPRAEPPPRSANGALIARTTSWVGRNVAGSQGDGAGGGTRRTKRSSFVSRLGDI